MKKGSMIFTNTALQPNLVGAIKQEINELHLCGFSKREINYRLEGWNGLDFDRIIVTGSKKDLLENKQK